MGPSAMGECASGIGDADTLLNPGIYSYSIQYETERWVVFGEDQDVLYWNVTGNGWGFPIRSASARVTIANLASEPALEAWTGPEGSTASAVDGFWDQSTAAATFTTNAGLRPREGLTVRVSFPSGVLTPPSADQLEEWFRLDWGGYIDAGYIILLVIAVYLLMWRRVGIDPAPGPISLRNEPPPGFSPAALGYLTDRGYDTSQFRCGACEHGHEGRGENSALRLELDYPQGGRVRRTPPRGTKALRCPAEDQERHRTEAESTRDAPQSINALKGALSGRLEREYFLNNRGWFSMGLFISIAGFAALVVRWRFAIEPEAWFLGLWQTIWTAGVATLMHRAAQLVRHARRGGGAGALLGGGGILIFSIPFVAAEVMVIGMLVRMVPSHVVLVAISLGVTNVVFYHLLERPTLRGRGVLNHLDGLELFSWGRQVAGAQTRPSKPSSCSSSSYPMPSRCASRTGGPPGLEMLSPWSPPRRRATGLRGTTHDHGHWDASSFASSLGSSLSNTLSASSTAPSSGAAVVAGAGAGLQVVAGGAVAAGAG